MWIDDEHEPGYEVPEDGEQVHVWIGKDCGGWKSYRRNLLPQPESAAEMEKRILDDIKGVRGAEGTSRAQTNIAMPYVMRGLPAQAEAKAAADALADQPRSSRHGKLLARVANWGGTITFPRHHLPAVMRRPHLPTAGGPRAAICLASIS